MYDGPVGEGDAAPTFDLPKDGGGSASLSEHSNKIVVLYFYPKDDTSGCTEEAAGFTEKLSEFEAANAVVFGVSRDSVASHEKFKVKRGLDVTLLSDESGELCERYGVWVEKSMYGKKYMGVERATFLIGPDGRIGKVWRKVKVPGHAEEVLAAVKAFAAEQDG